MAKFRDSSVADAQLTTVDAGVSAAGNAQRPLPPPANAQTAALGAGGPGAAGDGTVIDRSIGDILAELRNLTAEQVERVLAHQRESGLRFGEAAVALGFASKEDVLFALSQQFHYPYAPEERRAISPELVALNEPFSVRAEGFRAIRSQLMMRGAERQNGNSA